MAVVNKSGRGLSAKSLPQLTDMRYRGAKRFLGFNRWGPGESSNQAADVLVRTVTSKEEIDMVVLGLILLVLGLLFSQSILTTIGLILIVVGLILNFVPIGGSARRVW